MTTGERLLLAARLFDGERILTDQAVLIRDGRIVSVMPRGAAPAGIAVRDCGAALIAPGFIDLQVNGGGGVMLNEAPTLETVRTMAAAHACFGTVAMLPTLITDTTPKMFAAIGAVKAALEARVPGVLGIHLEGPYLSPKRPGIHDPAQIRPPGDEIAALIAALPPVSLVTLAPECVPEAVIRQFVAAGAVVAAGHSEASFEEAQAGFDLGITGVTHLFNAMSQLVSRTPGLVGAALLRDKVWCGMIADLRHVHPASLQLALRAKAPGGLLLVTDGMAEVGIETGRFRFRGLEIAIRDGHCIAPDGTLSGCVIDMASSVRNTVQVLGQDLPEALRMASLYPARAIRQEHELGRIAPGYRASLVALDDSLHVRATWIDGALVHEAGGAGSG